jgi:amino acid adenylation domain-containing protein
MNLQDLLIESARKNPETHALQDQEGLITYSELDRISNQLARSFQKHGVQAGDRVGIWMPKSRYAVAAMQAALRIGAAYVPVDPLSPSTRALLILNDCSVKLLVSSPELIREISQNSAGSFPILDGSATGSWKQFSGEPVEVQQPEHSLAYILYTSGSTGTPKGVCISHRNALAFVLWAVKEFALTSRDRFSNHAPFHFDLSVFDLYAAFAVGGSAHLIPEEMAYSPGHLTEWLRKNQVTIWYSVPGVLIMMMEEGELLRNSAENPAATLRLLLYAGEPFPVKQLAMLHQAWFPKIRFFNLYGPTETNVCTFYEVTSISPQQTRPVPIGKACAGDDVWIQKPDGSVAIDVGEEGELIVQGPTVMIGYWNQPPVQNETYGTGDWVRWNEDGNLDFVGRRDHLVKVRGHRIELGEIETILSQHPQVKEVAVLIQGEGMQAGIGAYLVPANGAKVTLLAIKKYCSEKLPRYMIVDKVTLIEAMPRTRNGKIDRLKLSQI